MTLAEYFEFEQASPERHEFVGGEVYAFAGGTVQHNLIAGNLFRVLADAADVADCQTLIGDVKLQLSPDVVYYPDIMVVCDPEDDDALVRFNPSVIVEVLSESTRSNDLREKLFMYRQIESLETYLIIEQNERKIYRHWRDDERLWWSETVPKGATIPIPRLGIEITHDDVYRNIPGL